MKPRLNAVQMAARFYDARDSLRLLFGERYAFVINPIRVALRTQAEKLGPGANIVAVALETMKQAGISGEERMMVLAAVADLIDDDERQRAGA